MTPPTTDELLRLAREAFDGAACTMLEDEYSIGVGLLTGDELFALHTRAGNRREALHAALLVLAGELDVAALLAERDRLRAEVEQANRVVHAMISGQEDP